MPPLLTARDVAVTLITKFIQLAFVLHPFDWRHPKTATTIQGPAQLGMQRLAFNFRNPVIHCSAEGNKLGWFVLGMGEYRYVECLQPIRNLINVDYRRLKRINAFHDVI